MKKLVIIGVGLTVLCIGIGIGLLCSGEKEALLKKFQQEDAEAEKISDEAFTTVELVGAAGNSRAVAEQQLFRALDYKLRHTRNQDERLKILSDFHDLSQKERQIHDTPREDRGSVFGMHLYSHIADHINQFVAVLLLDAAAEKRWNRIKDADLIIGKKSIYFRQGKAEFSIDEKSLEDNYYTIVYPKDTFTFKNRDFAVIRTDRLYSGNDDFSTVYLCELVNGKLLVHTRCEFPFISKWDIKGDTFTFYDEKKAQLDGDNIIYVDSKKVQTADLRQSPAPEKTK